MLRYKKRCLRLFIRNRINNRGFMVNEIYKQWFKEATPFDKSEVARLAGTALALLYQLSYGTRNASPELAGRIAAAMREVGSRARHAPLPVVGRGDIAGACAECPYYQSCKEYKE